MTNLRDSRPFIMEYIMEQGFSLTGVLLSLTLTTTTTLALFQQQWHVSQLFSQSHRRVMFSFAFNNEKELGWCFHEL